MLSLTSYVYICIYIYITYMNADIVATAGTAASLIRVDLGKYQCPEHENIYSISI